MLNRRLLKYGIFVAVIILTSFTTILYAFAYNVQTQVIYSKTFTIQAQQEAFDAFYLTSPAVMFEVNIQVSQGTIKWTPYSGELFEDTLGTLPYAVDETTTITMRSWECETDNGTVKWRIDPENLNQIWYLSFINDDAYEKQVTVEVTKVWSEQNYQSWM